MRCANCGKRFEPNKHAYGQKYCTHACKAAAERQKKLKGKSLKPVISAGCNFQTIPQAPNYEMNPQGIVRNKKTGYVLKWSTGGRTRNSKQMSLYTGGKHVVVTLPNLLWLMFGEITSKTRSLPVVVSKGTRSLRFDSCRQAALFLASVTSKTFSTCVNRFALRKKTVGDWNVQYIFY